MSIELIKIEKTRNKIWYNYYVSLEIRKFFNFKSEFFIEYDTDISSVPDFSVSRDQIHARYFR